jgi:hypothetical protein
VRRRGRLLIDLVAYNTKDLQNGDPNQKIPATPIVDASFSKDSNLLA